MLTSGHIPVSRNDVLENVQHTDKTLFGRRNFGSMSGKIRIDNLFMKQNKKSPIFILYFHTLILDLHFMLSHLSMC